jgi:spore coat polysaccharide biosynthesis predicted glycosyltransferase SpsG
LIKRIIFRADGNGIIGYGHFYRLLALAEMLRNDFTCVYVINQPDDNLLKQALAVCDSVIGLQNEYNYVLPDFVSEDNQIPFDLEGIANTGDIVVVDGYHFLGRYQSALHKKGCIQVFVDDFLMDYLFATAVINHAPGLTGKKEYKGPELCFGLSYAILRKPFFSPFTEKSDNSKKGIYVSLGGGDYHGFTVAVCKGLLASGIFSSIHVVCTKQFDAGQLAALELLESSGLIRIYQNISADEIVAVMDNCSFAFVAASTVLVEAYARGLICYTAYSAKNQSLMYNGFVNEKLAIGVGDLHLLGSEQITELLNHAETDSIKKLETPLVSIEYFKKVFQKISHGIA